MSAGYGKAVSSSLGSPESLLEEYLPLIRYHAGQLMQRVPKSIEYHDLVNSGVLGLLDAANRFDTGRGVQFSTFIGYRVRGAMVDYLRAFDWFPRSLREAAKDVQKALLTLAQEFGRPAEEEEIAKSLDMSLADYRTKLREIKGMSVVYFDDLPVTGDDDDLPGMMEILGGDETELPENMVAMGEFTDHLAQAIETLPVRERIVLTLYYYEELNMKEVALILALTESRVSQVHSQMVLRLRGSMHLSLPDE